MDGKLEKSHSSSSMPLISRLDHLDSMMYRLEGKKYLSARWGCEGSAPVFGGRTRSESVPLDFAVKEAQSKGSILDRITYLEERLLQLQIYMESNKVQFQSKSIELEQRETSPSISKRGFSTSFSRFRTLHHNSSQKQPISQVCMDDYSVIQEIKQNPIRKTQLEVSSELASQEKKCSRKITNKFEKGSPNHKRMFPNRLFHFRSLLGC